MCQPAVIQTGGSPISSPRQYGVQAATVKNHRDPGCTPSLSTGRHAAAGSPRQTACGGLLSRRCSRSRWLLMGSLLTILSPSWWFPWHHYLTRHVGRTNWHAPPFHRSPIADRGWVKAIGQIRAMLDSAGSYTTFAALVDIGILL